MIGKGVALAGMLCVMPVLSHTVILESGRVHLRAARQRRLYGRH